MQKKIHILYQGDCLFCNWCKDFLLQRDPQKLFEFVPISSGAGSDFIATYCLEISSTHPASIVVLQEGEKPKYKWHACLEIAKNASLPLRLVRLLLSIVPQSMGDSAYDWVARHRDFLCRIVLCGR